MKTALSIFSFQGRLRGLPYVMLALATVPLLYAITCAFAEFGLLVVLNIVPSGVAEHMRALAPSDSWLSWPLFYVVAGLLLTTLSLVALHIAWIASSVRRLHDIDVSGWIVLIPLFVAGIPYVSITITDWRAYTGYIIVALLLGCWSPSKRSNRFGSDPRSPRVSSVIGQRP